MFWEMRVEAAVNPARPEPTTMTVLSPIFEGGGKICICPEIGLEMRWRRSMDVRAMKREMDMRARTRLLLMPLVLSVC